MYKSVLSLLQLQSLSRLVANLRRTEVLDRTRIYIASSQSPLVTVSGERLERSAVKLNQSLLDNRLHLAMTFLHVHHHSNRDTTGDPLISGSGRVTYGRHITCLTGGDQARCRVTLRVAVVRIVIRRSGATTLVTEEVVLCGELAYVLALGLPLSQFLANHLRQ